MSEEPQATKQETCQPKPETKQDMCKFHRTSCFAVCNGQNWENCWMYKTNESVAKAQNINIQQNI